MHQSKKFWAQLVAQLIFIVSVTCAEVFVRDTGQFLAAVAEYGQTGQDTVVVLQPSSSNVFYLNRSDRYVSMPQSPDSFSQGQLVVTGGPEMSVVFDTAGIGNITRHAFTGTAQLTIANSTWVNTCALESNANGFVYYNSISTGLFPLDAYVASTSSRFVVNTKVYGYEVDIHRLVMFGLTQASPFTRLQASNSPRRVGMTQSFMTIQDITMTSVVGMQHTLPWLKCTNLTCKTVTAPDDPLIQSLRSQGRLLPLRMCNGTLVQPELVDKEDLVSAPMWRANDTATFWHSLDHASAASRNTTLTQLQALTPTVMLLADAAVSGPAQPVATSVAGAAAASASTLVTPFVVGNNALLITGPFIVQPKFPVLDLQNQVNIFRLETGGQVFLQQLTLVNLHTSPLHDDEDRYHHGDFNVTSFPRGLALNLPFMNTSLIQAATPFSDKLSEDDLPVQMYNVRMVVPSSDYLAILVVALSAAGKLQSAVLSDECGDQAAQSALSEYASNNMTIGDILTIGDANFREGFSATRIVFGDVWKGLLVSFMPEQPIPQVVMSTCLGFPSATPDDGSAATRKQLAIGLGVGLPVLLLVTLAVGAVYVSRASRASNDVEARLGKPSSNPGDYLHMDMPAKHCMGTPCAGSRRSMHSTSSSTVPGFSGSEGGQSLRASAGMSTGPRSSYVSTVHTCDKFRDVNIQLTCSSVSEQTSLAGGTSSVGVASSKPAQSSQHHTDDLPARNERCEGTYAVNSASRKSIPDGFMCDLPSSVLPSAATLYRTAAWCTQQLSSDIAAARSQVDAKYQLPISTSMQEQEDLPSTRYMSATDVAIDMEDMSCTAASNTAHLLQGDPVSNCNAEQQGAGPAAVPVASLQPLGYDATSCVDIENNDTAGDAWSFPHGQRLGDLNIIRRIAHGGQGTVYVGVWKGSLKVAVKVRMFEWMMPACKARQQGRPVSDSSDEAAVHRAVKEAAIAASVVHPNLVCTYSYAFVQCDDHQEETAAAAAGSLQVEARFEPEAGSEHITHPQIYKLILVQELCACDLHEVIVGDLLDGDEAGTCNQRPQISVLYILLDIARGLQYLADRNIVHGDVKDANILLATDKTRAPGVVAKLTDMGFAQHLGGNATHLSGLQAGTPFWIAPEVVSLGRLSAAADMYAFGILIWECFAGEPPCVEAPGGRMMTRNDKFPGYDHAPQRSPPPPVLDLQHRCLHQDPQQRPTAAQAAMIIEEELNKLL